MTRRTPPGGENTQGGPRQGGGISVCQGGTLHGCPGSQWQHGVPAHGGGNGCNCNLVAVNRCVGGVVIVGSGDDDNHPGIVVTATKPQMTTTRMSWLRSWWGPNDGSNVAAPVVDSGGFWFGLSLLS
jgi:hypothetical protein